MQFKDIIGLEKIKSHLVNSVQNGRIPHAQLFIGGEGSGTLPMAIAYAQYILCNNTGDDNQGGHQACNLKCTNLSHPDLHFAFPVASTTKIKRNPVSSNFLTEWRDFIKENPYANLYQWMQFLDIEKKQGLIGKNEALEISKTLSLKSFEGGYKIYIIWMAEKMNIAASNKLLKLIEEPPEKTVLLLIAEEEEQIIKTILSRCQVLYFPKVSEDNIIKNLINQLQLDEKKAIKIAHQSNGSWNSALSLSKQDNEEPIFEQWFITWIRAAFRAKGNASVIEELIHWSNEIASTGRETQKQFLHYCLHFFRQAMLLNYKADKLVYLEIKSSFDLKKFAPFIHNGNIIEINKTLNEAIYHIERNGSAKIILLDISIKLTRLLHAKKD